MSLQLVTIRSATRVEQPTLESKYIPGKVYIDFSLDFQFLQKNVMKLIMIDLK